MPKPADRSATLDCVFLFAIVVFSALPYLSQLGFYSDDWTAQARLAQSTSQGLRGTARDLVQGDPLGVVRPVPLAYLIVEFKVFGRHALGYHAMNTLVLALAIVFLYLAIRESGVGRWLAFAIALVYGMLPHYSTDRFWISAHQATLSMAFAFIGMYALLRSLRCPETYSKRWTVLAFIALLFSFLTYEVAVPMIMMFVIAIVVREYFRGRAASHLAIKHLGGVIVSLLLLLLVGVLKVRMQNRMTVHTHSVAHLAVVLLHLAQRSPHVLWLAARFNFWDFGLRLPAVFAGLHRHGAITFTGVAFSAAIAVAVAIYMWRVIDPLQLPNVRASLWLLGMSFVLFGLGFAIFALGDSDSTSVGLDNRTAIASALGAACAWVGFAAFLCGAVRSQVFRARLLSLSIALICGTNCLVLYGTSFFWAGAVAQQSAILHILGANVPTLPNGSVLLLDGYCRYYGPAVVFETNWDTTGAIQLLYHDKSLIADAVAPTLHLGETAVETSIYNERAGNYPYGDHLFVFHVGRQSLAPWPSKVAASTYLRAMDPKQDSGCPAAQEGIGEKVF